MDKIYKILVDILDIKAGFSQVNFFIQSGYKNYKKLKKVGLDPISFTSKKVASH